MLGKVHPRDNTVFIQHQEIKYLVFFFCKIDTLASKTHGPVLNIQCKVMNLNLVPFQFVLAPDDGVHPCQQLCECKRLGEVIIRSFLEPFHAVVEPAARGKYDDRVISSGKLFQLFQELKSISVGQPQIQKDKVVSVYKQLLLSRPFLPCMFCDETFFSQEFRCLFEYS